MRESQMSPRITERRCGGWIAFSPSGHGLKIGVTADTEDAAREKFRVTVAEWEKLLSVEPDHIPSRLSISSTRLSNS